MKVFSRFFGFRIRVFLVVSRVSVCRPFWGLRDLLFCCLSLLNPKP